MKAIELELSKLNLAITMSLPTHRRWTKSEMVQARDVDRWIVCGTNLLNSFFPIRSGWKTSWTTIWTLRGKCVLFGVGWSRYETSYSFSKFVYRWLLDRKVIHSVRDSYTLSKIENWGIHAVNTSCPTLWSYSETLTHKSCISLKSKILLTLTAYDKDETIDLQIMHLLLDNAESVALWPQGKFDELYARSLHSGIEILPYSLESFEEKISQGYSHVGTRLHAGIYALLLGGFSSIISIDNRAKEISRDTGLPIVERTSIDATTRFEPIRPILALPLEEIEHFRMSLGNLGGVITD
jgi:polysaccharide pyruvyl transferase WcaK-like protein